MLVWKDVGILHLISMIGLDSLLLLGWVVLGPLPALILPSMIIYYIVRIILLQYMAVAGCVCNVFRRACCFW